MTTKLQKQESAERHLVIETVTYIYCCTMKKLVVCHSNTDQIISSDRLSISDSKDTALTGVLLTAATMMMVIFVRFVFLESLHAETLK